MTHLKVYHKFNNLLKCHAQIVALEGHSIRFLRKIKSIESILERILLKNLKQTVVLYDV